MRSVAAATPRVDVQHVDLGARSYDVVVGDGLVDEVGGRLRPMLSSPRVVVVSDANVAPLYLARVERSLAAAGFACSSVVVPAGEGTKDFAHLEDLVERIVVVGIERTTPLIALGGGVVGDITGLAAGLLLRGLPYVQVPTTLLSQVDSAVGGKTAINSRHGKNLIGLFHQPCAVLADVGTLATLESRQVRAGYAEVVKYGLIGNAAFFAWLERNGAAVCSGDVDARRRAVLTSCAAKGAIVAADEREAGERALLNLGHTFGHALEAEAGYSDTLLHGEAVAVGMALAFALSARLGLCPPGDADRVVRHLAAVGLPTGFADLVHGAWSAEALVRHMTRDKKVQDGRITLILAHGIGQAVIRRDVEADTVRHFLAEAVAARP
jgi:3-dehydroquinate synthase